MTNGRVMLTGTALALAGAVAIAQGQASATRAHADIKGEGITGKVELVERKQGTGVVVDITVTASGLKPGLHGVHLHAVGKCEPDFAAAGGHFDPGPASNTDPDANHPFHMGDVPEPRGRQGRQRHAQGRDDARHAVGRAALDLRRRRHRHHHPRQRGQGRSPANRSPASAAGRASPAACSRSSVAIIGTSPS